MDWWQTVGLMGTLVGTGTAVAAFDRHILRQEFGMLRQESWQAHERIVGKVDRLRDELSSQISDLRDGQANLRNDLGGPISDLRDGQTSLRGGLREVRRELKGMRDSLRTLREDFRAHVLGGAG